MCVSVCACKTSSLVKLELVRRRHPGCPSWRCAAAAVVLPGRPLQSSPAKVCLHDVASIFTDVYGRRPWAQRRYTTLLGQLLAQQHPATSSCHVADYVADLARSRQTSPAPSGPSNLWHIPLPRPLRPSSAWWAGYRLVVAAPAPDLVVPRPNLSMKTKQRAFRGATRRARRVG